MAPSTQTPTHRDQFPRPTSERKPPRRATRQISDIDRSRAPGLERSRISRSGATASKVEPNSPAESPATATRGQHIGLVLGLVLPHPSDDRGVGEPDPGAGLDPIEGTFERQVGRPDTEPLLGQDAAAGLHQEVSDLGLRPPVPATVLGDVHHSMVPDRRYAARSQGAEFAPSATGVAITSCKL